MRLLIVRIGAMGDVLHALAAVAALAVLHPDWTIDWVVEPRWADLLLWWTGMPLTLDGEPVGIVAENDPAGFLLTGVVTGGPVIHSVFAARTRDWKRRPLSPETLRDILRLRRLLRARRYDVCVDLQGSLRSAVIGRMAGAQRFLGNARPAETPAALLYRQPVRTASAHVIDQAADLLRAIAPDLPNPLRIDPAVRARAIPAEDAAEAWADAELDRLFPTSWRGRLVVLAPSAGWGAKEWPPDRFGQLARRLAEAGWSVLINTDPAAPEKAPAVVQASAHRAVPLQCTIAQLTAILRRTRLFIGGDTGPMHLADALGIPLVALFGPTDPARTGPYPDLRQNPIPEARALRHPASRTDHTRRRQTEPGLKRITVEEVFTAAMDLLGGESEATI